MTIKFEKLHGLGNDYVLLDERTELVIPEDEKPAFARRVCRRGFSIGADGVLFAGDPGPAAQTGDVQMRIFNADGSEAESCANGLRCTAYFHHGLKNKGESKFTIHQPLAGKVKTSVILEKPPAGTVRLELGNQSQYIGVKKLQLEKLSLSYHRVEVGNPHAVFFLEENSELNHNLKELPLERIGTEIQKHPDFADSNGINAEFVHCVNDSRVNMRVHERGVGETAACGTGSFAIATACLQTKRSAGWLEVQQPGGVLEINPKKGYLAGPAEHSYGGETAF